jgi:hypothetical protein
LLQGWSLSVEIGGEGMTDQERLAKELAAEMIAEYAEIMAAKAKAKPQSTVVKLVHSKPDTPLEDAIAANRKAETWLEGERRRLEQAEREFSEEQIRLSNDGAANRHYNAAYRRGLDQTPVGHANYYRAGEATRQAVHDARMALSRYVSCNIGRGDSDYDLDYHQTIARTPEMAELFKVRWAKVKAKPKPKLKPEKIEERPEIDPASTTSEKPKSEFRRRHAEVAKVSQATMDGLRAIADTAPTKVREAVTEPLIDELVKVFLSDNSVERLRYNTQKAEVASMLGVSQMDVHRTVIHIIEKTKKQDAKQELTQAHKAVALALRDNFQLWTDPVDGEAYASVTVGRHIENYRVGSGEFERWVRGEYGARYWKEIEGKRIPAPLTAQALHEGIATMKSMAMGGQSVTPSMRIGGSPSEVWLDLGDRDWQLVRVTAEGWRLFTEGMPGVAFIRKRGMLALPTPVQSKDIRPLRRLLNVSDHDFVLQVGWLLGTFRYRGPYPVDMITGVADAAKTTVCRVLQRLIDPNFADLAPLGSPDDLYVAAYNRYVLGFDNISYITAEQADALCRLSTGTGYAKRALRTDADQFMMQASRPTLLNGIPDDLADRSDLASRAIVSELPALDEHDQLGDEEFWAMFNAAQPRLLGALLNGVSAAMRDAGRIRVDGYGRIRMLDFARWAEAGCRALGFAEDEFLTAFVANQERAMLIAFKQDLVAQAVALLIEQHPEGWRGNTRPLLEALEKAMRKSKRSKMLEEKRWPKNDTWLGRALRRSAAVLRKAAAIEVLFDVDCRATGEGDNHGLEIRKLGSTG